MSNGYIYFLWPVGAVGPIKIGCSYMPIARLIHNARWSPLPLEIAATTPGGFSHEKELHEGFSDARLHYEWFRATPELQSLIADIQNGARLPEAGLFEKRAARILEMREAGFTLREIAHDLGVSEGVVCQTIFREQRNRKAA